MSSSAHLVIQGLPNELGLQVVRESVLVRGKVSRALRLRLVCKLWNSAVKAAFFALDLVIPRFSWRHPYRNEYIAHRVLTLIKPRWLALNLIRSVAERVLQSNTPKKPADLKACVHDLCSIEQSFHDRGRELVNWHVFAPWVGAGGAIPTEQQRVDQALLSAAAFYNDVEMAKQVLPHNAWLLSLDRRYDVSPLLGYPVAVAAWKGSIQVLNLFLEAIEAYSGSTDQARATVILYAADGNQLEALELGLEMDHALSWREVHLGLELTTDDRVLHCLLETALAFTVASAWQSIKARRP
ncbi:uncharacterized protein PG986_001463 [Apiospora aurea]|uniref:F-box domain-containing protein n=1 Tax=Apiospora aurea TaxID=335848 RepID=A0ABR1QXW9_9PEZI